QNAADVADRARGGGRTIGHVVEGLDRDVAGVLLAHERGKERREALLALPRALAVAIVHLHVRDQALRHVLVDERRKRLLFHAARGAAVEHGARALLADRLHDLLRLGERVDERRLVRGERLDAVDDARLLGALGGPGEALLRAPDRSLFRV